MISPEKQQQHKEKEKLRAREYRAKIRQLDEVSQPSTSTPYRSTQSLGKAVRQAQISLPCSPRKRLCVVESLAKKIGQSIANSSSASTQNSHACSEHTKELVEAFYNSDDVSWQAPGGKARIIIREINSDGEKIKRTEQIHYLLMSLKKTHNMYIESNPDAQIGLSKFCELRPKRVKLFDHIPHYVCVCSYHESVQLLLYALHQHTQLPVEFHFFIGQVTCMQFI